MLCLFVHRQIDCVSQVFEKMLESQKMSLVGFPIVHPEVILHNVNSWS